MCNFEETNKMCKHLSFLLLLTLECYGVVSYTIQEHFVITTSSVAGIGEGLEEIVGETSTHCGIICAIKIECTGVNYLPDNKTCILLHVEDALGDWEDRAEDIKYSCVNCEPGPKGEYLDIVNWAVANNVMTATLFEY